MDNSKDHVGGAPPRADAGEKTAAAMDLQRFTEKVNAYKARYGHPESISVNGAMAFMARMFYMYPDVARQWYDALPKATMD